ncbi:MAG: diguanylate cyclase [Solibacillus sp.]
MASADYTYEQLNMLFENSRDAVFYMEKIDDDYKYIYLNNAAMKLIEMNPIGKTVSHSIPPHLSKNIIHYYNLSFEKQEQVDFEDFTYKRSEIRKQKTSVVPIGKGNNQFILATTKDISVDRNIKDKYLFMRSVCFNSFLSTVLISTDFQLLEADPKFVEDFNIELSDIQKGSIFDLPCIDKESAPLFKKYIIEAQNGANITSKMLYFIDNDKVRRCFTATFSALTSNDQVIAVFVIMQEITQFIQQKEALKTTSHGFETFKMAINSAADVIFADRKGKIFEVNDRVIQNTGYTWEELDGQTHTIFNSGIHPDEFFKDLWTTINAGEVWRNEVCNRKKNGEMYWVDSTIIPMVNEFGEIHQFLTIQFNISAKKKLMSELYQVEQTFQAITENTNDFIVMTDRTGKIKYASPSYIRKLGYLETELLGMPYEQLLCGESLDKWRQMIAQTCHNYNVENKIDLLLETKENEKIWTEGNYTITFDFSRNEISEIIMVSREITERKELENKLMFMAYHDSLTHLPNRRLLNKEFIPIIDKANANFKSVALFYIDGDNFKKINDDFGHDIGDEFLTEFGQALVKSVKSEDLVVRLGGDEFLIVITDLSRYENIRLMQVENYIESIRATLKIGWEIRNHHFSPTSSIGISMYPEHGDTLDELIDLADRALYKAKQKCKNNYKICDVIANS